MTFSEALTYLKAGRMASRSGWNGKGMYLRLVGGPPPLRNSLKAVRSARILLSKMPKTMFRLGLPPKPIY